ncbi:glutathione S-transferase [Thiobacter aerophilum]|uniref:Glutathione S-transferase n=1 Tax=Thiobacter aerophilum TaxID=3121275 RepID=A0ABV0EK94_9BURK
MKLIGSLTSPFVRKVRIVAMEKHIELEFVVDVPWTPDTKVPDANPLGKVPVLVMDDGTALYDSRVIAEYLDTVTPVSRLIPEGNRQRIAVKKWEALADGIADAAALIYLERTRRAPECQSHDWIVRQEQKVFRGLKTMSEELGEKKFCTGETMNLADIAVGCCLGYLDFRFPEIRWREAHLNLARLAEKLFAMEPFQVTVPVA